VATDIGIDGYMVTRGVAIADIDGDGRLDFAVANQWEPSFLFHNESTTTAGFLGLHLLLPIGDAAAATRERAGHPGVDTVGRYAIGATATAILPDGRRLVSFVDGGNGHSGKRSPDIHFGLGDVPGNAHIRVELRWRDAAGHTHLHIREFTPGWHTVVLGNGGAV
jgi:hypothetical protein